MPSTKKKKSASLSEKLEQRPKKTPKEKAPFWKGPLEDGVTQSLLARFLICRERFRISYIEGLGPPEGFNKNLEYGQLWHTCEESLARGDNWEGDLKSYARGLVAKYPNDGVEVEKWFQVCKVQFPLYVSYWKKQPDVKNRTPLLQETVFEEPYTLPSGREVKLRGKFDAVDLIGKTQIYLQENKTKGDIVEHQLQEQLTFDLQTMFYMVALQRFHTFDDRLPHEGKIKGVRYNVIRRPLSGGKGSIRPHKATSKKPAETMPEYYARLGGIIAEEKEYWFMRWRVEVTPEDVLRFQREFLDPVLQQLCDWWDWVATGDPNPVDPFCAIHWRHPYGVYHPLNEGRSTDLDEYLRTGGTVGLVRKETIFPELEE